MDFFLGSGTTTAVAHKMKRKWIGMEMGEHFYTYVLPRMKRVLAGERSGISRKVGWQGGGFFKYCELEQFEDVLSKAEYGGQTTPFNIGSWQNWEKKRQKRNGILRCPIKGGPCRYPLLPERGMDQENLS